MHILFVWANILRSQNNRPDAPQASRVDTESDTIISVDCATPNAVDNFQIIVSLYKLHTCLYSWGRFHEAIALY